MDKPAREARVFWRPEVFASLFTAHLNKADGADALFKLPQPGCEATLLVTDDKRHLLLNRGGYSVQFACAGSSPEVGENYHICYELWGLRGDCRARLKSIERFEALYNGTLPLHRFFVPEKHAAHLRFFLQALDLHLAGASYREIAIALFGEERVKAEWRDPGRHLLDRTRYAVERGLYLMREGYRQFLK